jgi:hypothetical protein
VAAEGKHPEVHAATVVAVAEVLKAASVSPFRAEVPGLARAAIPAASVDQAWGRANRAGGVSRTSRPVHRISRRAARV